MAEALSMMAGTVERFPGSYSSTTITDELNTILTMLQKACPASALISFDFDGELHVHLDVRNREEVMLIQATLPLLGMGLFKNVSLGGTPHRPFYHRITALVAR